MSTTKIKKIKPGELPEGAVRDPTTGKIYYPGGLKPGPGTATYASEKEGLEKKYLGKPIEGFPQTQAEMAEWQKKYTFEGGKWYEKAEEELPGIPREGDVRINPITGEEETYKYGPTGEIGWFPSPTAKELAEFYEPGAPGAKEIETIKTDVNETVAKLFESLEETPTTKRKSAEVLEKLLETLEKAPEAPTAPTYLETYKGLVKEAGIEPLESDIANINKKIDTLKTQFKGLVYDEEGKPILTPLITGRVREYAKAYNRLVEPLINERNFKVTQLKNKYDTVGMMMSLTGKDYETERREYEWNITKNLNLLNTISTIEYRELTLDERKQNSARANLQFIANAIMKGGYRIDDLSDVNKTQIKELELAAGFPAGFLSTLTTVVSPKANIIGTTTDNEGNVSVITIEEDGSFKATTIPGIGKVKVTEAANKADAALLQGVIVAADDPIAKYEEVIADPDVPAEVKQYLKRPEPKKIIEEEFYKGYAEAMKKAEAEPDKYVVKRDDKGKVISIHKKTGLFPWQREQIWPKI